MKFIFKLFTILLLLNGLTQKVFSQCFQIESILADACDNGNDEGFNEMVRFKVGPTAINTSNMSVNWPANSWLGLIQNATTATKVAQLNAQITAVGGCGLLIQPTAGVLPANAKVILVTSYNFNVALNYFGAITENYYIIFQNNPTQTNGHFGNYNATPGIRTLVINFGTCSDTVSYQRSSLININGTFGGGSALENGATVNYTPSGTPTYVNMGCVAPVDVSVVDAGNASVTTCQGGTITLAGSSQNTQAGSTTTWSASSGSFSDINSLTSSYTINANTTGSIVLTLSGTNKCGATITDTITVNITSTIIPNFVLPNSICSGSTAPVLNTTSPNGVIGTWLPNVVSNTTANTYVFTPTSNPCATGFSKTITIDNAITPDFVLPNSICSGSTAPLLNTTSPNGVIGTWLPNVVSNSTSNTYIFTPTSNPCATSFSKTITIDNAITPDFVLPNSICSGSTAPLLNTTSPNGVIGTWLPNVVSNSTANTYVFTPTSNPCATGFSKTISIDNAIIPDFVLPNSICSGSTAPVLNTTSPNGVIGTWLPNVVSNSTANTYVFTPTSNPCATGFSKTITIDNLVNPIFDPILPICTGQSLSSLPLTSTNNISGTWSPALNNQATTIYTFVPNANQCASNQTLTILVNAGYCDIQKGISPNGDNKNDFFDLSLLNVKQLNIFNRYGLKVYSKADYSKEWFGQTDNGIALPDATYFYEIEFYNQESKTGWVYLNKEI